MTYKRRVSLKQWQVLRGVADGLDVDEIATRLGVSINTVRYHKAALYANLNVGSAAEAVAAAYELGIFVPGEGHHAKTA